MSYPILCIVIVCSAPLVNLFLLEYFGLLVFVILLDRLRLYLFKDFASTLYLFFFNLSEFHSSPRLPNVSRNAIQRVPLKSVVVLKK
jgi:hypothetical protein